MGKQSTAAKKRRQAKKKGAAKGGKRGNKGNFHGARAAFIAERFPEFLALHGQGRGAHKMYWDNFYRDWWRMFPWTLPLDRDPDPTPTPNSNIPAASHAGEAGAGEAQATLATADSDPTLSAPEDMDPELLAQKSVIIETTQVVCLLKLCSRVRTHKIRCIYGEIRL